MRKERKVRPGFTPQEDVAIFRGSRQQAMDARALPKGHIPGWTPPGAAASQKQEPQSKSTKKNEKRREKRKEKRQEVVREHWDSDDEDASAPPADKEAPAAQVTDGTTSPQGQKSQEEPTESKGAAESGVDAVADKLDKLTV